ncbi:hypothetical protein BSK64_24490 [Paenibacillus odorifer]|uniref:hypothetical protein n=1 Tax=Paenibacillus odorifer TaxID=189426 RepID=UPI00096DF51D|nr:hypothetical protein [Paenibacillus odorifer]OMD99958.1 hypothetical protein BSK64_24490 [Paenibacillus odorifer]
MKYTSQYIPLIALNLDTQNPRFVVVPNPDETSIMNYLIQYENVINISKGINDDGGLMPGERIIVCKENGEFIVLEGNRRICACKLLMGLLKTSKKIPEITEETRENLTNIHVDFVESRQSIQAALYKRHLIGIKAWSTEAKQFFFANRFLNGESIESISNETNSTQSAVRKAIQGYNLLHYTLNLPLWKDSEKKKIDHNTLELDPFLRPFNSKSKPMYNANVKTILKITFDEEHQMPTSTYGREILDRGLYILAKAAFVTGELTTRKYAENVPDFVKLVNEIYEIEDPEPEDPKPGDPKPEDPKPEDPKPEDPKPEDPKPEDPKPEDPKPEDPKPEDPHPPSPPLPDNPKVFVFFEGLRWTALQYNDPQDIGLMFLAQEIMKISKYKHYSWYSISATILMRALLEQSLKFHIRKMGHWAELTKNNQGRDPMLSQLIKYYKDNKTYIKLFVEKPVYSAFLNAVSEDNITFMDTVVHSTETILPSRDKLDAVAKSGMFQIINFILNEKKHWPE